MDQTKAYLKEHWPEIEAHLLAGTYRPKPVKRVEIPKPGGGTRLLGVPTILDRFIQQAALQVLTPIYDPEFSDGSHGSKRTSVSTATGSDPDAVRIRRWKRPKHTSNPERAGWLIWT